MCCRAQRRPKYCTIHAAVTVDELGLQRRQETRRRRWTDYRRWPWRACGCPWLWREGRKMTSFRFLLAPTRGGRHPLGPRAGAGDQIDALRLASGHSQWQPQLLRGWPPSLLQSQATSARKPLSHIAQWHPESTSYNYCLMQVRSTQPKQHNTRFLFPFAWTTRQTLRAYSHSAALSVRLF
jgi:hypothetical protein